MIAGGAAVRVGTDDSGYRAGLDRAEQRLKAFGKTVTAMGSKMTGFGVTLGTTLAGTGASFALTGTKLAELQTKMAGLDSGSEEFKRLQKEADRLNKIMGGESVQAAVKLSENFSSLKDSVTGIVVKVGGALAPVLNDVIDYLKKGTAAVAKFIEQNRALAPQAAIVIAGLTAAGVAIGALGAAFYVAGPLIRVAMIGASAATLAFGGALAVVNATVAVASAVLKVLAGIGAITAATYRILAVSTVSFSLASAACSLAVRGLSTVFGVLFAITKAVTIAIGVATVATIAARMGYVTLASTIKSLYLAYRLYTAAQLASAAASAVAATGIVGLIAAGAGLAAAFFLWTDAGQQMGAAIADTLTGLVETATKAFSGISGSGATMPGVVSGYFADLQANAGATWNNIVTLASTAFSSAKQLFGDLLATGTTTFKGISDAISSGNIQLAMDVLWAGLKVSWVQGMDGLTAAWAATLIQIEAALDSVGTNLKLIWDVALVYLEGAFDKFVLYIRNAMQDASGYIAETLASIDPTGLIFGDLESVQEETKAQSDAINQGATAREEERNKRLANAGDDAGSRKRADDRQARLDAVGKSSPELAKLQAELAGLVAKAAEGVKPAEEQLAKGQEATGKGSQLATSVAAPGLATRGSADAASSIIRSINSQRNPNAGVENKLEKAIAVLNDIAKKTGFTVEEVTL